MDQLELPANAVRFVLDGQVMAASNLPSTMTVLEYLRDVAIDFGQIEGGFLQGVG